MFLRKQQFTGSAGESLFLWGARQTGKSTLLKADYPDALLFDLLRSDVYERLQRNPALLRETVLAEETGRLVIIDEIQRIPELLNEVQGLMVNRNTRFILSGSSPRKSLRSGANLLGGRALRYELFPLVSCEIPDFDLLRALHHGLLPRHYLSNHPEKLISAYIGSYLRDEILAETLIGRFLPSFQKRPKRRVIMAPKFYYFDVGIANYLLKRRRIEEGSEAFGKAFEHFIYQEIFAHQSYSGLNYPVFYWRTTSQVEIDFVLGDHEIAIEVKSTDNANPRHLKGLKSFSEEYEAKKMILVSNDPLPRKAGKILILPWKIFLQQLWAGEIIS